MFDDAVDKREREQSEITEHVMKKTDRSMKMTLSLTPENKILVKTYAIRNNLTVSECGFLSSAQNS